MFEPQSVIKKTIRVPDSVAVEMSWRVKALLETDPHASRDELLRKMLTEYAELNRLPKAAPPTSSVWPAPEDERFTTKLEIRIPASLLEDSINRVLHARATDPCFTLADHVRRAMFDYFKRHPFQGPKAHFLNGHARKP